MVSEDAEAPSLNATLLVQNHATAMEHKLTHCTPCFDADGWATGTAKVRPYVPFRNNVRVLYVRYGKK